MAKHTITINGFSASDIQRAIDSLEEYRDRIQKKTEELIEYMCQYGEDWAINTVGHIDTGETVSSIIGYRKGNEGYIVAGGNAIWIEFGTGVKYNDAVGSSPHPKGANYGYAIGTYGEGNGANPDGWYYYDADGSRKHTFGIEANMFMYNTAKELRNKFPDFAKDVFSDADWYKK